MTSAPHNPLLGTWHLRRWHIAYASDTVSGSDVARHHRLTWQRR
jgi:hypothetical protein